MSLADDGAHQPAVWFEMACARPDVPSATEIIRITGSSRDVSIKLLDLQRQGFIQMESFALRNLALGHG